MEPFSQTIFFFPYVPITTSTVLSLPAQILFHKCLFYRYIDFRMCPLCFPQLPCLEFLSYKHYFIFYLCVRFHISSFRSLLDLHTVNCPIRFPRCWNFATLQSTKIPLENIFKFFSRCFFNIQNFRALNLVVSHFKTLLLLLRELESAVLS
jgi:hypothetical protein